MAKVVGHFDLDPIKYAAASVGETRSVLVTHIASGKQKEYKTRTEFWGHHKKKAGGDLAILNEGRDIKLLPEHFEVIDRQVMEPIENILHTTKLMVESAIETAEVDQAVLYIGEGESFRVGLSTLLKYKGQRSNLIRALALDDVTNYIKRTLKAKVITNIECDDALVMNTYGKKNHILCGAEKDFLGCGSKFLNYQKPLNGIIDTNCFGELYIGDNGKPSGYGRIFKMYQVCSQDDSDNYKAHCMSDVYWGETSAYKALVDSKDDKSLMQACLDVFKHLYPEPKIVTGWRGNEIEIDAMYTKSEIKNYLQQRDNEIAQQKQAEAERQERVAMAQAQQNNATQLEINAMNNDGADAREAAKIESKEKVEAMKVVSKEMAQ